MIRYNHRTVKLSQKERLQWKSYERFARCKSFLPTRPQADFIRAVGDCLTTGHRIFAVDSGNGTGKTTAVENVLLNCIYNQVNIYEYAKDIQTGEEWPGFFYGDLYQRWPQNWPKLIWYISHGDVLKETIEELKKWAIAGSFTTYAEGKSKHPGSIEFDGFEFKDNWRLTIKTIDQAEEAFQGANCGIIVGDERIEEWQFDYCMRRLRRGGIFLHTSTPVKDQAYFYDRIVDLVGKKGHEEKYHQRVDLFSNAIDGIYKCDGHGTFKGGGDWNLGAFGVQKKGNLEQAEVRFQLNNVTDEDFDSVILGRSSHLSDIIYPIYDPKIHLKTLLWPQHKYNYMYRMILDPHDSRPPAVIWVRIDSFGRRYVLREFPSTKDPEYGFKLFHQIRNIGKFTMLDFCKIFIEIEMNELELPYERITRIIDPNFGNKVSSVSKVAGRTYHQEYTLASRRAYKEMGYSMGEDTTMQFRFIANVNDDRRSGHQLVSDALKPTISKDVYLIVDPECHNVDLSLRRYRREKQTPSKEETHGPEKHGRKGVAVEEKYKDFADVVRYDHALPFRYRPPEKIRESKTELYKRTDNGNGVDWRARVRPAGLAGR